MTRKRELTQEQIEFIRENISTMMKKDIKAKIGISQHVLERGIKENGITMPEIPCQHCGELFQPMIVTQKSCGHKLCRAAQKKKKEQYIVPDWGKVENVSKTHVFYAAKDAVFEVGWQQTAQDFRIACDVFRRGILAEWDYYEACLRHWCVARFGRESQRHIARCLQQVAEGRERE